MKNSLPTIAGLAVVGVGVLLGLSACWDFAPTPSDKVPVVVSFDLANGQVTNGDKVTKALDHHALKSASKIKDENGKEVWPGGSGTIQTDSVTVSSGKEPKGGSSHTMHAGFESTVEFVRFMDEAKAGLNLNPTPTPTPAH
ncbi:MAG: hypothetical protein ACR2HH_05090 [Chthoniobacterales bacterium]